MAYASRKMIHKQYLIDQDKHFHTHEMVKEWNGSLVHISEYDPKHPQIRSTTSQALMRLLYKDTKISKVSTTY
jgi:hypothetical protein